MAFTDDTIDDNAANPKRVKTTAAEVDQHPLPDQIAYDRYRKGILARKKGAFGGLQIGRWIPPGTSESNEETP